MKKYVYALLLIGVVVALSARARAADLDTKGKFWLDTQSAPAHLIQSRVINMLQHLAHNAGRTLPQLE